MPTYNFLNTNTGEEFESFMSIGAREMYLKENPHIQPIVSAPAIVSGVSSQMRMSDGFKEVLSKVSEAHPTSIVADRYGKKSIKQSKTDQVVKNHVTRVSKR